MSRPAPLVRFASVLALLALALFCCMPTPAHAKSQPLHAKFQRAAAASPLDSVLFTMTQRSLDTLEYVNNSLLDPTVVSALDTNTTSSLAAVAHLPIGSMALVVEVTGNMQTTDSVYVGCQSSQGPTGAATDGSQGNPAGNQSNPYNWRWYDILLPASNGVAVNQAGTQTFVFPVPCATGGPNAFTWGQEMRFILLGDSASAARAFSTRAWLVTREH